MTRQRITKLELHHLIFSDIDECAQNSHTCDVNANCKNTVGSYDCQCRQEYGNTWTGTHIYGHLLPNHYYQALLKNLTCVWRKLQYRSCYALVAL